MCSSYVHFEWISVFSTDSSANCAVLQFQPILTHVVWRCNADVYVYHPFADLVIEDSNKVGRVCPTLFLFPLCLLNQLIFAFLHAYWSGTRRRLKVKVIGQGQVCIGFAGLVSKNGNAGGQSSILGRG